ETLAEIRLELRDAAPVDPFVALRASRECGELRRVAAVRDDETAVAARRRKMLGPPANRLVAERRDHRRRALALAPRREHPARETRACELADMCAALEHLDVGPSLRELDRTAQSRDACADDRDAHVSRVRPAHRARPARGISKPSRACPAAAPRHANRARSASSRTSGRTSSRSGRACAPPSARCGRENRAPYPDRATG